MPLPLGFDDVRLFEDTHVVGNGRLREFHTLLNIRSAEPAFLLDGASAFFFQRAQNAPSRGIRNGMQKTIQIRSGGNHDQKA